MPRGTLLSQSERLHIVRYDERGKKVSDIATNLNRSQCVVQNFLRDSKAYNKKRHERQRHLSDRAIRAAELCIKALGTYLRWLVYQ